ncbi:uncharacterized protein LOC144781658 isoform X2 [Lissotriton helveticus]
MTCNLENTSSREMLRQDSDKDILTFHDIAACFSEEEWKLLNEWQEELYNNVMKEIEQTLISLGPRIASSVFSLRVKAKDMYYVESSHSVHRSRAKQCQGEIISTPDGSLTGNPEGTEYMTDAPDADSGQSNDSTGPMISSVVSMQENIQQKCPVKNEPEPRETITDLITEQGVVTPIDALLNKEETDAFCFDRHEPEGVGNFRCTKEHVIITQVDDFQIKEETDSYCLDHHESEGRGSNSFTIGDPSMNRKKKGGRCTTYLGKSSLCKSSGKNNSVVLQSSNKEANSRSCEWTESNPNITGENSDQNESNFSSPVLLGLHHDEDYENLRIIQFSEEMPNTHRRDAYSSVNKINSLKRKCTKLMRTNSRARPYACPECEKTFVWKSHFIMHHRIHSGEKPFMCTFCPKKFNRQSTLDQHIRLHTGERPYKCTTCKMSFIRNCDLRYHCKKEQHVI